MRNFTDVKDLSFKSYSNFCAMAENEGIVLGEWLREITKEIRFDGRSMSSELHALGEVEELGLPDVTCMVEVTQAMKAFSLKKLTPVQALRAFVQNIGDIKNSKLRHIAYMNPIKDRDGNILFGAIWEDNKLQIKAFQINPRTSLRDTIFIALR
jgi:hypothetical protein